MIRINTQSETYKLCADFAATVVGWGAASIVDAFCTTIINNGDYSLSRKNKMCLGRSGLKLITTFSVSNEIRKNIDDMANCWNAIVDILDGSVQSTPVSNPVVEDVEDASPVEPEPEVVNG